MKIVLNILYLAAALMLSAGCQSSRNMESSLLSDLKQENNRLTKMMEGMSTNVEQTLDETRKTLSNLKVENKTVYYSLPDSTGKQYPTIVSETKSESNQEENVESTLNIKVSINQLSVRVDSLTSLVNQKLTQKEKIVELSWWQLNKDKVYLGIIIVLVLAGIWLKLKKII